MSGPGWLSDEDEVDLRPNPTGDHSRRGKSPSSRAARARFTARLSARAAIGSQLACAHRQHGPITLRRFSWEDPT